MKLNAWCADLFVAIEKKARQESGSKKLSKHRKA
jgi:hypothetical protein